MWKQEKFQIITNYQGRVITHTVDGIVDGRVGIHYIEDGICVTHLPTGYRLGPPFPSLGQAFNFANAVRVSISLPDTVDGLKGMKEDIGRVRYATQQS